MLVANKLYIRIGIKHSTFDFTKNTTWRRIAFISFIIITVLAYLYPQLKARCSCDSNEVALARLNGTIREIFAQLTMLTQKHYKLIAQIKKSPGRFNISILMSYNMSVEVSLLEAPSVEYETVRRRIYSNMKEMWLFINYQLRRASYDSHNTDRRNMKIDVREEVAHRKRWLLAQQEKLVSVDGHESWRQREAASLGALVQRRLRYLQNPRDCPNARKLVCEHNQGGFGCKHHHLMFCLMYAYATNRTLILSERYWAYTKRYKGWASVFYALSDTCTSFYNESYVKWTGAGPNDAKVVHLPILDFKTALKTKPLLLPYFIPEDLAQRIGRINSDPSSWWAGEMLRYILRPRPHMERAIYQSMARMNLTDRYGVGSTSPMVGIHVRRTDKVKEAPLFDIHVYMFHVADYYAQLEQTRPVAERRVYIATDDDRVLKEAKQLYPEYSFYGDESRAQSASTYNNSLYPEEALSGLLVDLHMLTMSDFVVLTYSSNYGKMAYELMQTIRVDAPHRFHSLDDVYYMCSSTIEPHYRTAVMRSTKHPRFEIGDLIKYYYFSLNSFGKVMRTKSYGSIPWYKTVEHYVTYPFPEYEQVPISHTEPNQTESELTQGFHLRDAKNFTVFRVKYQTLI